MKLTPYFSRSQTRDLGISFGHHIYAGTGSGITCNRFHRVFHFVIEAWWWRFQLNLYTNIVCDRYGQRPGSLPPP